MAKITTMNAFIDKMEYEGNLEMVADYLGYLPEDFEDKDFRDTFNAFANLLGDLNAMVEDYYEKYPDIEEEE